MRIRERDGSEDRARGLEKGMRMGLTAILLAISSIAYGTGVSVAYAAEEGTRQVVIELEAAAEEKEGFRPGEDAGYVLTLKNKLGPAWIRVRFGLSSKGIDKAFTDKDLRVQDGWVRRGGYFYYTRKAEAHTDYMVVDGIRIPDASVVGERASVTVSVYGEAIQYDSITPDFSSETPWEGAKVEHSTDITGTTSTTGTSSRPSGGGSKASRSGQRAEGIHPYSSPQERGAVSTGSWELIDAEAHSWKYHDSSGQYAKDGWIYVYNPYAPEGGRYDWFHFDKDGIMTFGWYRADERIWYHCHGISDGDLGRLDKGWHEDEQDGKRYFLDRKTGIMLSGWQEIDGEHYYLATYEEIPGPTWFWETFGDTGFGRWVYEWLGCRSYGSMYAGEKTPDGHEVDADGKRKG